MGIEWQLPPDWKTVKLGLLAQEDTNQIRPAKHPTTTFNYWGLDAIEKSQFTEPQPNWVYGSDIESTCVRFDSRHVLYSKLRPYLNKVITPSVEGIGTTEWIALRPNPGLADRYYLAYVLRSEPFVTYATANSTGARMPRARKDALWEAPVPIPYPDDPARSLETQRRIVARLDALLAEVAAARRLHEEIMADTAQLMSAASRQIIGDVSARYATSRLGTLTTKIGSGSTPRGGRNIYPSSGIPFIRSLNVRWNVFSATDLAFIDKATHQRMIGTEVRPGDVLLNITGASIGRACCVPVELCPTNVNQHVSIIRPARDLRPRFLMYWLTSPETQDFIMQTQSGATRQALTKAQIENFEVPLPPTQDQDQVVAYLDQIQDQVSEMKSMHSAEFDLLSQVEQAMLNQAFRGEL